VQANKISGIEFQNIVAAADVKRICFHGCRHTSATLLLMAGVPVKVVSERLGHAKSSTTMDIYSHVLPRWDAARRTNSARFCTGDSANFLLTE
jgi:integrase